LKKHRFRDSANRVFTAVLEGSLIVIEVRPGLPTDRRFRRRAAASQTPCRSRPPLDILAEPEEASARAEVDDGWREVGVARPIEADGVALGEAEELGDGVRVEVVVVVDLAAHVPWVVDAR
jgi:hypothetical protein